MDDLGIKGAVTVNLHKIAHFVNILLPVMTLACFGLGYSVSFYFHFLTVAFFFCTCLNIYYRYGQKQHSLLRNFGIIAQGRYLIESLGPELRQYLYSSDTEERPFNRVERSTVYKKAKGIDATGAFGSQRDFDQRLTLKHSMYPLHETKTDLSVVFGEERGVKKPYRSAYPVMLSAMSYGALGQNAVRALARGAGKANVIMNTGEGGFPKYHLMEDCDLTFQMGTGKFGVRNDDGTLNEKALKDLASHSSIRMVEIKLSQGAKPGKGGLLPKEKLTPEIAELRGVPEGQDVVSPPFHVECDTPLHLVQFIDRVQKCVDVPVGIKLCLGQKHQFVELVQTMKEQNIFPDYISIDGAEGGTGAAPESFLDHVGTSIWEALPFVVQTLKNSGVRDRLKVVAAGRLVNSGDQMKAMALGADAVYTARGFLLALGCVQTLQCNRNTCPVGITTHNPKLQHGLDIEDKSERVRRYVEGLVHEYHSLLQALSCTSVRELSQKDMYL